MPRSKNLQWIILGQRAPRAIPEPESNIPKTQKTLRHRQRPHRIPFRLRLERRPALQNRRKACDHPSKHHSLDPQGPSLIRPQELHVPGQNLTRRVRAVHP